MTYQDFERMIRMYAEKTYNFPSMLNIRDLGGHKSKFGLTRYGTLIRSDAPYKLSQNEIDEFMKLGVTTVIDFRSKPEIEQKPCVLAKIDGVKYYNIPMYGGNVMPPSEELVAPGYFKMIEDKETIYKIMHVIATSKGNVLYHCSAGKDRTGVISALLLTLVGVSSKEIAEDYYVSWENIKQLIDELLEKNPNMRMLENRREYIEDFLQMLNNKYGTANEYLMKIGLTNKEIEKIKAKLVV